jgi:NADH-quinone oxidoreductase subunit K
MSAGVPLEHALVVAGILFVLGLGGVMLRRNIIFVLMCLEIMLNSVGLAFVAAGARWGQPDGQLMFLLILTLAAAEVAIALALVLQVHHRFKSLDTDVLSEMKG